MAIADRFGFREQSGDPGDERLQILGAAAGGEVAVPNKFLVQSGGAAVDDVVADARPTRQSPSFEQPGGCEHPGAVAQSGDLFFCLVEGVNELRAGSDCRRRSGLMKPAEMSSPS